ncbi:methyltransferase domain-containing protein [Nocardioides sp. AE5]|uniref:class I SAM-dependent methyltransferase n=1 Tax=Nocardioides sp. AE5 TaxID=2962573 RepID=UPI002882AB14|nr:methyltransferase domain-containing protein [Nocardioides sp. AE5]MDT0200549.1 methyltransferase domain-containing protein [Nocardioides sp. AE5]
MDPQSSPAHHDFPAEAVTWLLGASARTVAVLGEATIAAACSAQGHDVTDVVNGASARALPFPDSSVDVVVSPRIVPHDLAEITRVLRPGGQLALVRSVRDRRIPWARKLDAALGVPDPASAPASRVADSALFGTVAEESFRHWQTVTADTLADVVAADVAHLGEAERAERLAAAAALYADYGRGMDGMQLPWISECFRATLVEKSASEAAAAEESDEGTTRTDRSDEAASADEVRDNSAPQDGSDSDLLLIDFR